MLSIHLNKSYRGYFLCSPCIYLYILYLYNSFTISCISYKPVCSRFFVVPLFSCQMYKTNLGIMLNNTRQNREAFGEILNRAAWDYAYLHSWKTTQQKPDGSVAILKRSDKRLSYCIDNHSVKDFKAYKVCRTRLQ